MTVKENLRTAWYIFAFAMISTMLIGGSIIASLPECPTEDSDNCRWTENSGNGQGDSFIVINGWVIK